VTLIGKWKERKRKVGGVYGGEPRLTPNGRKANEGKRATNAFPVKTNKCVKT